MYTLPEGHVICMRTCDENLKSHGGFQWPESGEVVCPDWSAKPECGNGLHGLLWGMGQADLLNWSPDAKWLAVEVEEKGIINLNGKVKFQKCRVVLCGDRKAATDLVSKHAPNGTAVIGLVQDGGDRSTITGGYRSTITGGYRSTITGGDRSTITGGYRSTITGGDRSTITGGDGSTITGGDGSTITGGDYSTITGGDRSTITGGDGSTITGGHRSTITGGDYSTLVLTYWDSKTGRNRCVLRYVGEDGIKPGVAYVADGMGGLMEAVRHEGGV